ncbi:MAG: tetratricopeptide repeat protein [Acidiphilium sp.]|nr:tetratricopeptide repeat protein [Acidiphilium sp.]MDD4935069.1 tetratricopeptide repeat protein [Acidiphilium sp.]
MRGLSFFRIAFLAAFVLIWQVPAYAETGATPQQLQTMIAGGHEKAALLDLQKVLRVHPQSGVAWYLVAEAQDAAGNRDAARSALAKAETFAPGLPFAQADKVAALKAHLAGPASPPGFGVSPAVLIIGGLVILFIIIRLFARSRRVMSPPGYQNGYGFGSQGVHPGNPPPFGPVGAVPYPTGIGAAGSGAGSAIITGLAAGAGFAAGERIIEGLTGAPHGERPVEPNPTDTTTPAPERDDGLSGSPGWGNDDPAPGNTDTLGSGGDFDPGNDW